ncbi:cobalamin B12-binding domain-containing protein [Spirochaeta isovalerica]|uniref:Methylmalonyl-CoA mutase cobalamin-binding domain/chain n=1 Tax=Spirochaeta isovalerica TaxID=150 RepID=A0A841R9Z1_9SPIO|nr:cobalamin-dependent protein [Spirochaeta isovalerica]MBB6480181.1 methylmalonyl-CoA mutase cobalamin-binding domain/chain [Spirochaeta isovalerica]
MDRTELVLEDYFNAIFDTDRDEAIAVIDSALESGMAPQSIIFDIIIPSISRMERELVDKENSTLAQHYICSKVSSEITDRLIPLLPDSPISRGTIVLGTARGDYHGLGKKIVGSILNSNMFKVIDIGINVRPELFVRAALENNASVIGISSMMVHTSRGINGPRGVRKILKEKGLEKQIKIIVGGAPYLFDRNLYLETEADAWSPTAIEAVDEINRLLKEIDHDA